jgi:hypothetical protein
VEDQTAAGAAEQRTAEKHLSAQRGGLPIGVKLARALKNLTELRQNSAA